MSICWLMCVWRVLVVSFGCTLAGLDCRRQHNVWGVTFDNEIWFIWLKLSVEMGEQWYLISALSALPGSPAAHFRNAIHMCDNVWNKFHYFIMSGFGTRNSACNTPSPIIPRIRLHSFSTQGIAVVATDNVWHLMPLQVYAFYCESH